MSNVKIYLQTNDNDVTNQIFMLLKQAHPKLDITLLSCFEKYKDPTDRPFYQHMPINAATIWYHFDTPSTNDYEDYLKLKQFAQEFKTTLSKVLSNTQLSSKLNLNPMNIAASKLFEQLESQKENNYRSSTPSFNNPQSNSFMNQWVQRQEEAIENKYQSSNFFSPKSNPSNKAKYALAGAVVCGILGVGLFFLEPYTATFLILCAFVLLYATIKHSRQEPEMMSAQPI